MFRRSAPRYSLAAVVLAMALGWGARAAPGEAPDDPAGWLATGGKDAGWTKATAKCRELLGKIKLDDPVVKSHLPRLKARCLALRKVRRPRGWYEVVPVRFLEAMLEDLAKGVERADWSKELVDKRKKTIGMNAAAFSPDGSRIVFGKGGEDGGGLQREHRRA